MLIFQTIAQAITIGILIGRITKQDMAFDAVRNTISIGITIARVGTILNFFIIVKAITIGIGTIRVTGDFTLFYHAIAVMDDDVVATYFFVIAYAIAIGIHKVIAGNKALRAGF